MNPSERDRGSYIKDNFEPLVKEGVLHLIDGEIDFDENISFRIINGHTFAQQMIKISDSSNTILYCCDLMPFVSQIRIPYVMGYDLQPMITVQEKKKYLQLLLMKTGTCILVMILNLLLQLLSILKKELCRIKRLWI